MAVLVELVRTTTADGVRLDGALSPLQPEAPARVSVTVGDPGADPSLALRANPEFDLAICLHGVGTNFYGSNLYESLIDPLNARGINVLRVNTRGRDGFYASSTPRRWHGSAFETIDECRLDVLAWLAWAKKRGFENVLLLGHSLGAIKALYAAAHEELPGVGGVIALSPPRLSHEHFRQGPERAKYLESLGEAEKLVQEGRQESLFLSRFPFPMYITAAAYIDKYGPGERYNILHFLARVKQPTLITYGSEELPGASFFGIVEAIESLAPPQLSVKTIDGADHIYTERHAEAAAAIGAWLER